MFCDEIVERTFTSLNIYLITLGKDVTFPLITKFKRNRYNKGKSNTELKCGLAD